jgi:hypothetical protein
VKALAVLPVALLPCRVTARRPCAVQRLDCLARPIMQSLPQLEELLRVAFEARSAEHPSGVALASYFARAPSRGRKRSDLDLDLLFPRSLGLPAQAVALATDPGSYRSCENPKPTEPSATREWLAEAALTLGKAEGFALTWPLLRAMTELEGVAQKVLGARTPRAVVRQVLHGVSARTLHAEPFAALLVRVLKIAQTVYAASRHAGLKHEAAFAAVQDRLWSQHPTGSEDERGAYLPSLVQAASGHARRRIKRNAQEGRTQDHARVFLSRFANAGAKLWPWRSADGLLLPFGEKELSLELAAVACFVLLTHTASERRSRGGPSGGLSAPFVEAGFAATEWLPDRTDDLAVRLFTAAESPARGEFLSPLAQLLRAALSGDDARAFERLPDLLRWVEENGRELLERA